MVILTLYVLPLPYPLSPSHSSMPKSSITAPSSKNNPISLVCSVSFSLRFVCSHHLFDVCLGHRFHRTVISVYAKIESRDMDWDSLLCYCCCCVRVKLNAATRFVVDVLLIFHEWTTSLLFICCMAWLLLCDVK